VLAQHLFTTRQLRLRSEDLQASAWGEATAAIGGAFDRLVRVRQVHGRTVRVLGRKTTTAVDAGFMPEADAVASDVAGTVLAVQAADCVPILMADARVGAAAAVHAGWRGTSAGVASATVDTLSREFGTHPEDLVAAIGPSIGPCCYEVGAELVAAFRAAGASEDRLARWFTPSADGSWRLDLWTANYDQLIDAGLRPHHVHRCWLCTKTHADLFDSYRADGPHAGRMAALIRVPSVR
jgi:YfiH family protein